ncbi:uncharacterized protein MELLADRAFT_95862 [Melampsora larici-populina 98AG31]|uniref:Uncharacterized protein n=1 Tax=Melampsora larici-populina (strain 98AG31 / pathotype 3-4-7) TaxID=747676 RepID=F4RDI5_MELLP|nr:uncharacterized protein MELLADRAFT_95862 [Melampsora larici-populina 98AG31]EGG09407.1 hypothetical protein MELLADRAFT_95862 [Melampsora larici-populina 98AG31]
MKEGRGSVMSNLLDCSNTPEVVLGKGSGTLQNAKPAMEREVKKGKPDEKGLKVLNKPNLSAWGCQKTLLGRHYYD